VEELVTRAAQDFEVFYPKRIEWRPPQETGSILVITVDGKGVVMRREDLRQATRQRAEGSRHKLQTRLSRGEKRNAKRMATVAAVYTLAPQVRTAEKSCAVWRPATRGSLRSGRPRKTSEFEPACRRPPEEVGIAKVLEPTAQRLLITHTGTRCMTPAYASPEQVRGKSVTPASDIYSLGVVLYEMLSGHRPYRLREHTLSELERAICEQEPETPSTAVDQVETETASDGTTVAKTPELVSQTREGSPERLRRRLRGDLDNIVLKALRKEPERRYGSVAEFAQDIGRHLEHLPVKARRGTLSYRASKLVQRRKTELMAVVASATAIAAALVLTFNILGLRDRLPEGAPITRIRSLAVLPLQNLSGDAAQEYFSDGMTDALITDLAQIGSLKVISRTSVMHYKKTDKTLPQIARELNVDGIVEGSVQRSGDRVRITAQLIYGPSDNHLWANSYERDLQDVFTLERDVASDIAHQVQARLTTEKQGQGRAASAGESQGPGGIPSGQLSPEQKRRGRATTS
jgi:TolB-like protein